ncbi:MAG: hypothetical protein E7249_07515 [Paenibacillaceae bacterium]|nr:hypothetical protein [Paenibacillaceae bacterium]
MEVNDITELLYILSNHKIIIFGAGYVATRFYGALKKYEIEKNVVSFATTTGSYLDIDGISIIPMNQLESNEQMIICVAVHDSIKDAIIADLINKGIKNFIWIYPFLYKLLLGAPIYCNKKVTLSKIWNAAREDYGMAIRYLAIDNYYGKNINGYKCYKKYLSLFNSDETSERRLIQFIELIKSWEQNGYDTSKCSSLYEDYRIFDGAHRIAVASYFNQGFVMCNIFNKTKNLAEIHNQGAILEKQYALDAGFEPELIDILDATNQRIEEQYK